MTRKRRQNARYESKVVRSGSWLCENEAASCRRARLIPARRLLRTKDLSGPRFRILCCAPALASSVFTQPGSDSVVDDRQQRVSSGLTCCSEKRSRKDRVAEIALRLRRTEPTRCTNGGREARYFEHLDTERVRQCHRLGLGRQIRGDGSDALLLLPCKQRNAGWHAVNSNHPATARLGQGALHMEHRPHDATGKRRAPRLLTGR